MQGGSWCNYEKKDPIAQVDANITIIKTSAETFSQHAGQEDDLLTANVRFAESDAIFEQDPWMSCRRQHLWQQKATANNDEIHVGDKKHEKESKDKKAETKPISRMTKEVQKTRLFNSLEEAIGTRQQNALSKRIKAADEESARPAAGKDDDISSLNLDKAEDDDQKPNYEEHATVSEQDANKDHVDDSACRKAEEDAAFRQCLLDMLELVRQPFPVLEVPDFKAIHEESFKTFYEKYPQFKPKP